MGALGALGLRCSASSCSVPRRAAADDSAQATNLQSAQQSAIRRIPGLAPQGHEADKGDSSLRLTLADGDFPVLFGLAGPRGAEDGGCGRRTQRRGRRGRRSACCAVSEPDVCRRTVHNKQQAAPSCACARACACACERQQTAAEPACLAPRGGAIWDGAPSQAQARLCFWYYPPCARAPRGPRAEERRAKSRLQHESEFRTSWPLADPCPPMHNAGRCSAGRCRLGTPLALQNEQNTAERPALHACTHAEWPALPLVAASGSPRCLAAPSVRRTFASDAC